jgi:hypothetical protein
MELWLELAETQVREDLLEEPLANVQSVATQFLRAHVEHLAPRVPQPFVDDWLLGEPDA